MSRPSSPPTRVPPRVIPANNEDKPVVDSMLVRMKKIEEYEDKIKNLLKMREKLITEIQNIDILLEDYEKLRNAIR